MIRLANDHLALTLEPDFGARVTALSDRASGRQWLVPGDCLGGDTYLADQARGWDECFPSVGPCHHPAWGAIRDHGELWGRPWQVASGADRCTATRQTDRFSFARSLCLQGSSVIADYQVSNHGPAPLPYLWSQHALLATTPADRIVLTGVTALRDHGHPFDWPDHPSGDLSAIGPGDAGFALKCYGAVPQSACVAITGPDGGIAFDWSGFEIPAFGLWLDYGGWPPGAPVHQVALEPTTAPADDLAAAAGAARVLAPGEVHRWSVRITLTPPVSVARPL